MASARRARQARILLRLGPVCVVGLLVSACFGAADPSPPAAPSRSAAAASPSPRTASESPAAEPAPAPEPGACRRVSTEDLRSIVNDDRPVPCRRRHTVQTFHVGRVPARAARDALAASDERVEAAADRICRRRFRGFVGGNRADRRLSLLSPTYFLPPSDQFALGARWVRCDVFAYETPARLADLPRRMRNALERGPVRSRFTRCSPVSPSAQGFRHVACERPHRWRAVAVRTVGGTNERYPGARRVQTRARERCEDPVRDHLGTDEAFAYGFEVPRRDAWAAGDRLGLCWARTSE